MIKLSYKLIIVDDEQMMRDGLSKTIQWEELGFVVDAMFSDGDAAISYLKGNIADVVLTDIKMPHTSGLDIAQFIYENKLSSVVVLLSGHRDFEYAQTAIHCNVKYYLLKPISVQGINDIFTQIKNELDNQTQNEEKVQQQKQRYNTLVNYQMEQFITDIVLGTLQNESLFYKRLDRLGFKHTDIRRRGWIVEISSVKNETMEAFIEVYGRNELTEQLVTLLKTQSPHMDFYSIKNSQNTLFGVFLFDTDGISVQDFPATLSESIRTILGIEVIISVLRQYESLLDMAKYRQEFSRDQSDNDENGRSYYSYLREQKKLLFTYIDNNDAECAVNLFRSFILQCNISGIDEAKNQIAHFFSITYEALCKETPSLSKKISDVLMFSELYMLADIEDIIYWGVYRLSHMVHQLHAARKNEHTADQPDSVVKIKQYIEKNYSKDISLNDMAEMTYLNPVYLSRIFKEKTGSTFIDYLTAVRIEASLVFLDNPQHYIYEICSMVGYQSLKHFYKVFRRLKGCSPTEYRRRKGIR